MPADAGTEEDLRSTTAAARVARCLVVDGYAFDLPYLRAVAASNPKLAIIDDLASLPEYPARIVVNQNIDAPRLSYSAAQGCRMLLGPGYALLRPEFARWRSWSRPVTQRASKLLVTLGGGDTTQAQILLLHALSQMAATVEARFLYGAADAAALETAAKAVRSAGHTVELRPAVDEMPEQMAWADFAVAAGGSTVWELCFMQLPALLLVLAENQRSNAEGVARAGAAIAVGDVARTTISRIAEDIEGMVEDGAGRERMAKTGRTLVDGLGARRVAEAIAEISR